MTDFLEKLKQISTVETDVSMARMTTLRIGGNAKYVVYPSSVLELENVLCCVAEEHLPYKIIGKGSNILASDHDYEGVVIRLDSHMNNSYFMGETVVAEAGCSVIALSYECMKHNLSGIEFASGIPGTVGGCIYMNAGAYKSSMAEIVDAVKVYHDGITEWIPGSECEFAYRTSIFMRHPDWIILAVRLQLEEGEYNQIHSLMDSRRERRMASQPLEYPSAGSVFRNPMDVPAWQLIEGIGFRGKKIGGAQVSEKHVNFIVNAGGATAADFVALTDEIKAQVKDKYGIDLHMEVEKFNWQ